MIHIAKKEAGESDASVYGISTDDFEWKFYCIDHESRVSQSDTICAWVLMYIYQDFVHHVHLAPSEGADNPPPPPNHWQSEPSRDAIVNFEQDFVSEPKIRYKLPHRGGNGNSGGRVRVDRDSLDDSDGVSLLVLAITEYTTEQRSSFHSTAFSWHIVWQPTW